MDMFIQCLFALGMGGLLGYAFAGLTADPLPWIVAREVVALDGDSVAVTLLLHLDSLDTAELDHNRCDGEQLLARRAYERLGELLQPGPVRVQILGQDQYGRVNARFTANGRPVDLLMEREGLAQRTGGQPGVWCPEDKPPGVVRSLIGGLSYPPVDQIAGTSPGF